MINRIEKVDFDKRKSLDLACKRFQRAYQEYEYDDKLIDYMIAFEALFFKGEKSGYSRGKIIAIACSNLLGRTNQEREEIKETLTIANSMRNSIVHGSEYANKINPFEIVEATKEHLRQSIIKYLE